MVSVPQEAAACDPVGDDFCIVAFIGTPVALGTILVAPLVGLAIDQGPGSLYFRSLGYTTLAAGIGWGIGMAVVSPEGEQVSEAGAWALAALPLLFGSVATYLTYRLSSRPENGTPQASRGLLRAVWVVPTTQGVSLGVTLRL